MQIKLNTPFVFEQMVCHYASSEFAALQDASETITYDSAQNQTGQQFLDQIVHFLLMASAFQSYVSGQTGTVRGVSGGAVNVPGGG